MIGYCGLVGNVYVNDRQQQFFQNKPVIQATLDFQGIVAPCVLFFVGILTSPNVLKFKLTTNAFNLVNDFLFLLNRSSTSFIYRCSLGANESAYGRRMLLRLRKKAI